ncbi:outer membrane biogenesis protein BamB [Anaerohalosphaera lusitana]|uniref:Outer membrane biogenesis protein BamB n=1 Tax=Anaerohalosphaera lusitana TaxID=1936003 RepID=A0A1U9NNS2_9BACT|nr:PQQ-binding-like beta-propeller repeat protein [Anaerohalosphaera lusitana]AQT69384.1 outer membrane biogenesis protein BamB [Anaerohalosphaera lusitana]
MFKYLVVFAFIVLSAMAPSASAQTQSGMENESDWLVSNDLLQAGGMAMAWQINMPLKADEDIDRIFVFDDYAYVLTDSNFLFCINTKTGTPRFSLELASKGLPVCNPTYAENKLYFIIGNDLKIVDPAVGSIVESQELPAIGRSAYCGIAKTEEMLYVAGSNNRLTAINPETYIKSFQATADDDSPIYSFVASSDYLVFATTPGTVFAIDPLSPEKDWEFIGAEGLKAPLVDEDGSVYISSLDTKVYKLNISNGRSEWPIPFEAGSPLQKSVRLGQDVFYQYAGQSGFYAADKETGKAVWELKGGLEVLTEESGSAYIFTAPGVLTVMDNNAGEKLYSVNFSDVTDYAVNTEDKMYIANDDGRFMAIEIVK